MDERSESNGGRSWINGPTCVVLVAADRPEHDFDRQAPGLNPLAFHAASREQVDRITDGVRERADSAVRYGDDHPCAGGYYVCYCEDPAGIRVVVVAPGWGPGVAV